ncbi:MAG TPA: glycosyltransferase family 2 protein [Methylophilaceae bacterium]|jgi:cellulose synthase/poly-beta-1,6-N-acetylglucosamine synthase-like glycosyltransferase
MNVLRILIVLFSALIFIPVLVFLVQVVFALPGSRRGQLDQFAEIRPSIGVLVPAHNESSGIAVTLNSILYQLHACDRLLVVADNCTDDTAGIASSMGAEVIRREDAIHRGKGYALDFGVQYFADSPPEILIIVDADCYVEAGALDTLAKQCAQAQRPIQALYLMHAGMKANLKTKVAEFAWATKNWARALGYQRLGLPCQLMGTGMAFPWELIQKAELATGHIVEDLKLGLDLAAQGYAPQFCPQARVTSLFPMNEDGVQAQRKRWEHGHLGMILRDAPQQLFRGLRTGNWRLIALVLDMCVPPLALLALLAGLFAMSVGIVCWQTGQVLPWVLGTIPLALLILAVLCAWAKFGRHILSLRHLTYAPIYALAKIPLYLKFLVQRQVEWVRSQRDRS